MKRFTSTKLFKVVWIAALFAALVAINPAGIMQPIRGFFIGALLPFQKVAYSFSLAAENVKDFVGSVGELKKENEDLFKKNQDLLAENASLHDLQNENTMLRSQLDLLPRGQYDLVSATITSQDPNGLGNWMTIDKGSADGITAGMPVIFSKGILIGRIHDVYNNSSSVMLLTNPKSTVNVITTQSQAKGVARGEYGLGLMLDMILQTDTLQGGDTIVTSGMGGDIPKGLFVGTLQDVHPSDDHLFQQATINEPLQVSKLQIVFVIRGQK
jgi:rod shape-determining protein MreC